MLYVALERLLRQEVHRANGRHGVTCLMDMSTFYDTINLQQLQEEALKLNYPPLMLEMAMQVYHGPKAIVAEQEMTPFFTVTNGVPAGCPQAPLLAKAVLAPALQPWQQAHPDIHLSAGWTMLALTLPVARLFRLPKKLLQPIGIFMEDYSAWASKSIPRRLPSWPQTKLQRKNFELCCRMKNPRWHRS